MIYKIEYESNKMYRGLEYEKNLQNRDYSQLRPNNTNFRDDLILERGL